MTDMGERIPNPLPRDASDAEGRERVMRRVGGGQCGVVLADRMTDDGLEMHVWWGTSDKRPVTEWVNAGGLMPWDPAVVWPKTQGARNGSPAGLTEEERVKVDLRDVEPVTNGKKAAAAPVKKATPRKPRRPPQSPTPK